ncbi:MAG: MFS transporter [Polyangiales bacterium]
MEFVDSSALSTALPTLARAFDSDPVHLKLALTSYLLALAVFAPASGWVADRFGAKRVFLVAMLVFLLGSGCCGMATSLPQLVLARIVQGCGGAMMTPVGRVILVGATPRAQLVSAMAWFTTPALVGPLVGPPIAGFILSVADWRWIFYVNLPIGALGLAAVLAYVPDLQSERPGRFDLLGFVLTGIGITTLMAAAETVGAGLIPVWLQLGVALIAALSLGGYVLHASRSAAPILNLDLLRVASYRASVLGGTWVRLGLGAMPFLLPLLLQVGLGWEPAKAGFVAIATAAGAIACKPVAPPILRRFGFRKTLLWTTLGTAVFTALPAVFDASTPLWLMVAGLALGGFVRSMQFTGMNSIAYADVDRREVSQASTLATVTQQIGMSFGVSFGALLLHLARDGHDEAALTPDRFVVPFAIIGAVTLLAAPVYARLDPKAGANIAGR